MSAVFTEIGFYEPNQCHVLRNKASPVFPKAAKDRAKGGLLRYIKLPLDVPSEHVFSKKTCILRLDYAFFNTFSSIIIAHVNGFPCNGFMLSGLRLRTL